MGLIRLMERGGDDLYEYKKALKMAKKAVEKLCKLSDEMEEKYSYDERDDEEWNEPHDYRRRRM